MKRLRLAVIAIVLCSADARAGEPQSPHPLLENPKSALTRASAAKSAARVPYLIRGTRNGRLALLGAYMDVKTGERIYFETLRGDAIPVEEVIAGASPYDVAVCVLNQNGQPLGTSYADGLELAGCEPDALGNAIDADPAFLRDIPHQYKLLYRAMKYVLDLDFASGLEPEKAALKSYLFTARTLQHPGRLPPGLDSPGTIESPARLAR